MRTRRTGWMTMLLGIGVLGVGLPLGACGGYGDPVAMLAWMDSEQVAGYAIDENPAFAEAAVRILRERGSEGLDALKAVHAERIAEGPSEEDPEWTRLADAIDATAQQRDAWASGLFWHVDIEAAREEAVRTGRPILSLRLLGRLTDELSCANSRFFRTILYADRRVAERLREGFVLHWHTVREVPRITIDFGDGRRLERTITGNSAHYVLDADGRPIEVLPGLYAPEAFLARLGAAMGFAGRLRAAPEEERDTILRAFHREGFVRTAEALDAELLAIGAEDVVERRRQPMADAAMRRSVSKSAIERPMFDRLDLPEVRVEDVAERPAEIWAALAERHREALDTGSLVLIGWKRRTGTHPDADADGSPDRESETIVLLERSVAEDTVRNEFDLHQQVRRWFADGSVPGDPAAMDDRLYADVFKTPAEDAWMGLHDPSVFTAIDRDGVARSE